MNITGGPDLSLLEVNEAAELIQETADPDANIIFGADIDESMGDAIKITVIATGFDKVDNAQQGRDALVFGGREQLQSTPIRSASNPNPAPRPYQAANIPNSAENAFSARPYAQLQSDPVEAPVVRKEPKESTFTEENIRRDYNNRPANKLDIPAFLRK